jgi:hypothetical protein
MGRTTIPHGVGRVGGDDVVVLGSKNNRRNKNYSVRGQKNLRFPANYLTEN